MTNGGYYTEGNEYTPPMDKRGPMMFFPPHCVGLP
jgi:hypothetical protein